MSPIKRLLLALMLVSMVTKYVRTMDDSTRALHTSNENHEAEERAADRSRNLGILFGFYTFAIFSLAIIGVLLTLSMIGVNVFRVRTRLRALSAYESL